MTALALAALVLACGSGIAVAVLAVRVRDLAEQYLLLEERARAGWLPALQPPPDTTEPPVATPVADRDADRLADQIGDVWTAALDSIRELRDRHATTAATRHTGIVWPPTPPSAIAQASPPRERP